MLVLDDELVCVNDGCSRRFNLGWDAWKLGVESASVVAQRSRLLALGGPDAGPEAVRMIAEKVEAGLALQGKAWRGELGLTPVMVAGRSLAHYRRKVRANGRRRARG